MRTYIQKLSVTADKIREREQPLSEIQIVSKALTSLPETFRIVRSVWASVPAADRTLDHLLQRLLTEENVIKSYQKKEASAEGAFPANSGSRGGFGRSGYRGRGKGVRGGFVDKLTKGQYGANHDSRPRCNYCKIAGHIKKECYKKHGYPGSRNVGHGKEEGRTDDSLFSSSKFDPRSIFAFFADSGATNHICDQRGLFPTLKPVEPGTWSVSGIGGTKLDVLGIGNINIAVKVNETPTLKRLHDVLYVAGLGVNLFSIGAATASGLKACFENNKVSFIRGKEVVLTGERKNDTLYQLNFKPEIQTTTTVYAHACSDLFQDATFGADLRASLITWHKRLGHIGYHTLVKMIRQDLVIGLNIEGECEIPDTLCSGCELAKFTRIPLKIGRHRANRIGELTHSDVWGPIATSSLGGARYFVSFKDDFSSFLTIYFMKKKNEVPALIRLYHAMLLN